MTTTGTLRGSSGGATAPINDPAPATRPASARFIDAVASDRASVVAHYATLALAAVVLVFVNRNQWFYFDEWAFMLNPGAELWAGHGGHWSTLAIAAWMAIQSAFGLDSYFPFIVVAILTHLVTAHLLWRLLRRVGAAPWIATAMATLFALLGAASENLLWAFQFAFMGAIACGIGATLLAMGTRLTIGIQISIALLMTAGAATSGTLLPFFLPVALIIWRLHGWRRLWLAVGVPAVIYATWYLFIAGPNSNARLRAEGIEIFLTPLFAGSLLVGSIGQVVPIPGIGAVILALIGLGALVRLRERLSVGAFSALSVAGAGVLFGLLTGYSRWGIGLSEAGSSRYVYMVFVTLAPIAALLLTTLCRRSRTGLALVVGALAVVCVYNTATLVVDASAEASREGFVHESISAGLALHATHPDSVDLTRSPEPTYQFIQNLEGLIALEETGGLTTIPFSRPAYLTALVNVGLKVEAGGAALGCLPLIVGGTIESGETVSATTGTTLELAASDRDGLQGQRRTLTLEPGPHTLTTADRSPLVVTGVTGGAAICQEEGSQ